MDITKCSLSPPSRQFANPFCKPQDCPVINTTTAQPTTFGPNCPIVCNKLLKGVQTQNLLQQKLIKWTQEFEEEQTALKIVTCDVDEV